MSFYSPSTWFKKLLGQKPEANDEELVEEQFRTSLSSPEAVVGDSGIEIVPVSMETGGDIGSNC